MLYYIKRIYKKDFSKNQGDKPGFFDRKHPPTIYFIAKKKIFKKAVDRNRAKRRAKNAFKEAFKTVLASGQFDDKNTNQIIFFLEHDIIQESYLKLVDSFKKDLI
jgi:ribonuclease P protein component